MSRNRLHTLLMVSFTILLGRDLWSAELNVEKYVVPELTVLLDERFNPANQPGALDKFVREVRQITPGGYEVGEGKLTLIPADGPSILVRPAPTGAIVQITIDFDFPRLMKLGERSETQVGFVLPTAHQITVHFDRKHQGESGVASTIRCLDESDKDKRVLREYSVKGDLPSGAWTIVYHHGLLRVTHNDKTMGLAYAEANPNTLGTVGVMLGQDMTPVRVRSLKLMAMDAAPRDAEAEAALQQARTLTAEAAKQYTAGQFDAALTPAIDAVINWRKARGEDSVDVSNAATNLAQIQLASKRLDDALNSYSAALQIRQKELGDYHPLTSLVHVQMANILRTQGKPNDALNHFQSAISAYDEVYGKESQISRALRTESTRKDN